MKTAGRCGPWRSKSTTTTIRPALKKALFISVNTVSDVENHQDVLDMKELIMSAYDYKEENIVVMLEGAQHESRLQPTRNNMIREMKNLVKGAQRGDKFFFHFSGHTIQKPSTNKKRTEEDGMDEYLVPCDKDDEEYSKAIKDNFLRQTLVDCLPVGTSLVAIFDSCNSGSLLDLPHHRCNRVYVPWLSRGRRRSNSLHNNVVRQNGVMHVASMGMSRTVYQNSRKSSRVVKSRRTTMCFSPTITAETKKTRPRSLQAPPPMPISLWTETRSLSFKIPPADPVKESAISWFDAAESIPRCESPTPEFRCDGFRCAEGTEGDAEVADVISFSAARDDQTHWQSRDGRSMTAMLVEILRREPHLTLHELLIHTSHRLYAAAVERHRWSLDYNRRWNTWVKALHAKGQEPDRTKHYIEMSNFQNPELSSHVPQDLNRRWHP